MAVAFEECFAEPPDGGMAKMGEAEEFEVGDEIADVERRGAPSERIDVNDDGEIGVPRKHDLLGVEIAMHKGGVAG